MNDYEREMMELYKKSLGEKTEFHGIVCPGTYKKPCRLCDLCKEVLFNRGIPKEAPLRKRASSLNAKQHYFSNVVFLADPTNVVVFEYGDKIFKQLLAMQMNADQGFKDFWHPIVGRWLIIERIQGATKEQVDYYVKPKDPTKLADMPVLSRMYNLDQIIDLIKDGKVKSIYQSKLEKTSIVRILPSWLGPDYGMKFFQKIDYHYNISEEDFKACLAGEVNPVRINGGETNPQPQSDKAGGWGTTAPSEQKAQPALVKEVDKVEKGWSKGVVSDDLVYRPAPVQEVSSWEKEWNKGLASDDPARTIPIEKKIVEKTFSDDRIEQEEEDELPPCYGDYDSTDPDCTPQKCPDWSDGCRAYRDEKLAKRRAAKRLTR